MNQNPFINLKTEDTPRTAVLLSWEPAGAGYTTASQKNKQQQQYSNTHQDTSIDIILLMDY